MEYRKVNSNLCLDECLLIEYAPICHKIAITISLTKKCFWFTYVWLMHEVGFINHYVITTKNCPLAILKKSPWQGAYQIEWKGHKTISSFDIKLIYDVIMLQVEPGTPFITQAVPLQGSELCVNEAITLHSSCRLQSPVSTGDLQTRKLSYWIIHKWTFLGESHSRTKVTQLLGNVVPLGVKRETRSVVLNKRNASDFSD